MFLSLGHKPQGGHTSLSLQKTEGRRKEVVYHKDLIKEGQGRRKESYQGFPSSEGQSSQVFSPSREGTSECSLSIQLQGEHTSPSLQKTEGRRKEVVYHKDLIKEGQGRRKESYQGFPSSEGQSSQVFSPSREGTSECSLSIQLQGEHTSPPYRGLKDTHWKDNLPYLQENKDKPREEDIPYLDKTSPQVFLVLTDIEGRHQALGRKALLETPWNVIRPYLTLQGPDKQERLFSTGPSQNKSASLAQDPRSTVEEG